MVESVGQIQTMLVKAKMAFRKTLGETQEEEYIGKVENSDIICDTRLFEVDECVYAVSSKFLVTPEVCAFPHTFPFLSPQLPATFTFTPLEEALDAFASGHFLVVMDDETRENEGDLIIAAEDVDEKKMAFMIRYSTGIVCAPMLERDLRRLEIPLMVENNTDAHKTAFTVTVDAARGVTTGVSARDRCETVRLLANPNSTAIDFSRPGHVFPLQSKEGGVLERRGHTEAATDLCLVTGKSPVGVISEIVNDDGTMARRDSLFLFAYKFGLKVITVQQLVEYRSTRRSANHGDN